MRRKPRAILKGITYMTRMELIQAVHGLCDKLSKPLPPEELAAGWTELSRIHYLEIFKELETVLRGGVKVPYFPIAKNLNHSGISSGEFCEDAVKIDLALNERKW